MHFSDPVRRFAGANQIKNLDGGLLVRQCAEAYIARNWQLSQPTEELIKTAIGAGLSCMIRNDHPRRNGLLA